MILWGSVSNCWTSLLRNYDFQISTSASLWQKIPKDRLNHRPFRKCSAKLTAQMNKFCISLINTPSIEDKTNLRLCSNGFRVHRLLILLLFLILQYHIINIPRYNLLGNYLISRNPYSSQGIPGVHFLHNHFRTLLVLASLIIAWPDQIYLLVKSELQFHSFTVSPSRP